jgi:hypothetical protein
VRTIMRRIMMDCQTVTQQRLLHMPTMGMVH